MKDQVRAFFPKPTIPVEMFANDNYLHELEDTEFKRTTINIIK